ncbi:hypothetical protein C6P40_003764 [Pichia californica]|uniref:non-specific serine/threonine protein kinase n=1 Tax=Pichia californica TaxID=460514 RepID=A0A9P6WQQ3_9ASCO|nr:hypothetical protein C6P42_001265 [[Candida] californica]KAG0690143.1 hypothetical protein C6P40_003764 [[Candida] californica]
MSGSINYNINPQDKMSQPASKDNRRSMDVSTKRRIPREVRFGNYVLGSTLGEGEFGKVKLGWRKDGKMPSQAAIKLIKRDSIPTGSEKEGKIYREITALKKLRHPNIVRLVEVLQNDKYIGIVLEYASGGELFDYILDHRYLKESLACRLFAQLVSGVDYMHAKGIVHRDLKLENLLLDKHKNIIITDFGFVNSFQHVNNDLMKTSCGSPCYAAPELVVSSEPYEGKKVDIWSCGVILYAMLAGYLPFDDDPENPDGSNIARLYHYITHTPLTFPEYIQPTPRDLLRRILVSDPNKRISLQQIRAHQWLAPHTPFLSVSPMEWDRNYRSSKVLTQQEKISRRMSLMENPTSATLMLNKQNVRSYSTQNVQASLYSNPAEPQTSRTVAIPSAEASPVASPVRQSKVSSTTPVSNNNYNSVMNNNNGNNNITNSASNSTTRHTRSGSTASIALQAVVDADVEIKRRYSNGSDILTTPVRNTNQRPISFVPILSDNKNFETIKESPEHQKMLPPPIPVFKQPNNATMKLPSSRTSKPRPTSYHPSYTTSTSFNATDLSFIAQTNMSESSLRASGRPKISSNSTFSSTSESLISASTKELPNIENNNSDISESNDVTVTDIKAGTSNDNNNTEVLSKESATDSVANKQPNRNSYAMDLLTNAMDTLSMISKATSAQTSNIISSNITQATNQSDFITTPPATSDGDIIAETTIDNTNDITLSEINESDKENIRSTSSKISTANKKTQKDPLGSISNNVNNDTKYKRFSLLTFYQSIPGPTAPNNYVANSVTSISEDSTPTESPITPVTNDTSESEYKLSSPSVPVILPKVSMPEVATDVTTRPTPALVSTESNLTSQKQRRVYSNNLNNTGNIYAKPKTVRKPLEPSNVKSERRVSNIYTHSDKTDKVEKETSTARKVMDFFKRRSMRI